ncbi:MAG TPA: serine hydrolase [Thermoanaerobaculia bacterium]|nr:serine hydrolase [Thermoanaerobaculia bacterium]
MIERIAAVLSILFIANAAAAAVVSDADIRAILADRIDVQHQGVGIVVGVIDPSGRRVVAYGKTAKDGTPVDANTVFEIGSVTKVFTSLLLADMVQRGEVALTDPVSKYLPPNVKMPERGGKKITLIDLATHTSGLPSLPSNFHPKDPANPYADYTVAQLYEFLATVALTRDIGSRYEYSNLGGGLLGQVLARRAGTDYETLVRTRILDRLGMKSTAITLSKAMKDRLAIGHDAGLQPVSNWDLPTLAGAGALRSDVNDLLTFLAANLALDKSPLTAAMTAMLATRRPTGVPNLDIALGWHISTINGHEIVWHNGGTGGYRTWIGFDPKSRTGVVVLSNTSTNTGVDDIGAHLLDPTVPLVQATKQAKVDPAILDRYTGRYALAPTFVITVTREGDHLYAQATSQPRFEIFAKDDRNFFYKVVDAQLTFVVDANGRATSLVLHQNGADHTGKRVEGDPPPAKERKEIAVDPKIFDGYVGRYQLAPNFILTITRDGGHLYTQATGQPRFEIFAESVHDFFVKDFDAQLTFVVDANGRATSVVLHQGGRDAPAKRIE